MPDPENLQVSTTDNDATLTWDAPAMPDASHVDIFRRGPYGTLGAVNSAPFSPHSDTAITRLPVGVTSYEDSNLDAGFYAWQVFPLVQAEEQHLALGFYSGWNGADNIDAFEADTGLQIEYGHEFGDNSQWSWFTGGTNFANWETWVNARPGRRFTYSAPLIAADESGTQAQRHAKLANGDLDHHFTSLGNAFQARPALRNAIVRLGWEFNGNTFPWNVPPNDQTTLDNYKIGFKRASDALRAACPTLEIEWCPNIQLDYTNRTFADMVPDASSFDYIGLGHYDYYWPGGSPTAQQREDWLVDSVNGYADQVALADSLGKGKCFTEYGLWGTGSMSGGGDRPEFITLTANWMRQHGYSYHIYSNFNGSTDHRLDTYPNAKAEYIAQYTVTQEDDTANPIDPATATHTISLATTTADGEGNFSSVQPGDVVAIESGARGELNLDNFHGTPENPIIFVNDGGVVAIDGSGYAGIYPRNSSNIRITGSGAAGGVGRPVGSGYTEVQQDAGIVVTGFDRGVAGHDYSTWALAQSPGNIFINIEADHMELETEGNSGIHVGSDDFVPDTYTTFGWKFHHLYIHDVGRMIQDDVSGEGLYIGKTSSGLNFLGDVEVYRCLILRCPRDGIQVSQASSGTNFIAYNHVEDVGLGGLLEPGGGNNVHGAGIVLQLNSNGDIYNNTVIRAAARGIYSRSGNVLIYNNLVIEAGDIWPEGGIMVTSTGGTRQVFNNTVVNGTERGFELSSGPDAVVCQNNIAVGNSPDYFKSGSQPNFTISHNLSGDATASSNSSGGHIDSADPLFVDAGAGDYRLQSGSPAVGAGTDLSAHFNDDIRGVPRPQGGSWDLGAYEYNGA